MKAYVCACYNNCAYYSKDGTWLERSRRMGQCLVRLLGQRICTAAYDMKWRSSEVYRRAPGEFRRFDVVFEGYNGIDLGKAAGMCRGCQDSLECTKQPGTVSCNSIVVPFLLLGVLTQMTHVHSNTQPLVMM